LLCCLNREIMESTRRPHRFKYVYRFVVLYTWLISYPSAIAPYWAFGETIIRQSNAFGILPSSPWRMTAIVFMVMHQVSNFSKIFSFFFFFFLCKLQSFNWEKRIHMHPFKVGIDLRNDDFNLFVAWKI
jgi:auxin influx carrier (AUX1 LAX family)